MSLLTVQDLTIGYETRKGLLVAVEGVSFALDKGKSFGLVGESGCGKTTIGKALMGLLPPNGSVRRGRILFDGGNLLDKSDEEMRDIRWKEVSMIFQAAMNALNPVRRVSDQIAEAILTHNPALSKSEAMKRVEDLFGLAGIPKARMRDFPHQYSGGMKQRAYIAMALACRPRLIIADEPTTALDVIVQDQILKETRILQDRFDTSIIFISHDISIVAEICHTIGIMYAGQLVEYGPRDELFTSPIHPYTKALLSSFPTLAGDRVPLVSIPGEPPNLIHTPPGCRFYDRCTLRQSSCKDAFPQWARVSKQHKALCFFCE